MLLLLQGDETYETQSRISFVASRYENGELITCEANNPVLEANQEEPQRASTTLEIHCEYSLTAKMTGIRQMLMILCVLGDITMCHNGKVSEQESVRIGMCQNVKMS